MVILVISTAWTIKINFLWKIIFATVSLFAEVQKLREEKKRNQIIVQLKQYTTVRKKIK